MNSFENNEEQLLNYGDEKGFQDEALAKNPADSTTIPDVYVEQLSETDSWYSTSSPNAEEKQEETVCASVSNSSHIVNDSNVNEQGLIDTMAEALHRLAEKQVKNQTTVDWRFSNNTIPKTSLNDYISRLCGFVNEVASEENDFNVSPAFCSLVMSLIYIDRIHEADATFQVTEQNVHRLFLTSFVVATKTWRDKPIPNVFFARVGGIPVKRLNSFEVELCKLLKFNFFVRPEQFEMTVKVLSNTIL